ncbi:Peptidyl-prolyl isomerase cwc27 [Coemansia sp. RSA 989]|nr:Peptidyl-prolyl isomerase cwc27 [Coemansia sp. RSA 989]KAJ1875511.1 Peptidyl-prolyl isomerase cwc27 [Coemansia sp. RSA 990]
MSSVYVSEPPTSGKVVLETSAGDVEIELWSKEAPKACRNFIQLCLEGYYNGTIFHRVSPGWIVQGGDPTGTGTGGESVYGAPFADEFHSRLRFNRRGMLGMASTGPNGNGSQFFITLSATPELQKKHTLFGTVVGSSLFNALKLGEGEVDKETERPVYPKQIVKALVVDNPFADIVPRRTPKPAESEPHVKTKKIKSVKNKHLLSFADDENDDDILQPKRGGSAMKSSHDLLVSDPMLSKSTAPVEVTPNLAAAAAAECVKNEPEPSAPPASQSKSPSEKDMKNKIEDAEQDIQRLNNKRAKRMPAKDTAASHDETAAQPKDSRKGMLSMLKGSRTNRSGKRSKASKSNASEAELFARINAFQSRIRSTKKTDTSDLDAVETDSDERSWLAHSLRFNSK